jgi:hypothetical protein
LSLTRQIKSRGGSTRTSRRCPGPPP